MQRPFSVIKNMISCFAHDKNHWINLLEVELPSCSLEALSTLAIEACRRKNDSPTPKTNSFQGPSPKAGITTIDSPSIVEVSRTWEAESFTCLNDMEPHS